MLITKTDANEMRFRFHHELEQLYHRFFDEIAQSDFTDREAGILAQTILRSRQESLKHLVSALEMEAYLQDYPEEN